jgi:phenylpropionate dioxygenase-like ring-hydroxylating dioxygenase large terminal subunit
MQVQDEAIKSRASQWTPQPTLPGRDYYDPAVYEADRERIFHSSWTAIAREEEIAEPGDFITRDLAGESIIVTRTLDGGLRGYFNVCRHRGTRLVDDSGHVKKVFTCPYHAWSYDLSGNCVGTPNVHRDEGFDRSEYSLWGVRLDTWAGFVFANLGDGAQTLTEQLADDPEDPTSADHYRLQDLRLGRELTYEVACNWKILIENFNECLHCPTVHPELVQVVPIYRKGEIEERDGWGGNSFAEGASSMTTTGASGLPMLPGISTTDAHTYYGFHVFPNMLMNLMPDAVMYYMLFPRGPEHTTVVSNYLFRPETIAGVEGFDEKAGNIVDFWDMVSKQDWNVCEREQTGVRSRAYANGGVYPFQDRLLRDFNDQYQRVRGPVD